MTTKELECFIAVAQTKSFKRAADLLFITQPTISYQIHALEEEIGFNLFDSEKRTKLTSSGIKFLNYATKILDEWSRGVKESRLASQSQRETLHIGLRRLINESAVATALRMFYETQEDYAFTLHTYRIGCTISDLLQGNRDIQFVDSTEVEGVNEVAYQPLCKSYWGYAIHKDHPLAQKEKISIADLTGEIIMLPEVPPGMDQGIQARDILRYGHPSHVMFSSTHENAIMCAAAGVAISSINYSVIYPMENVVYRPAEGFDNETMGLAWRKNDKRKGIEEFVRINHKVFKSLKQQFQ